MPSRRVIRKVAPTVSPSVAENESVTDTESGLRVCEIKLADEALPFRRWLFALRDVAARARILMRLDRIVAGGNFGDHRERIVGAISELRIDYGPGYRIYYVWHGNVLVVLLGGGTKDGQQGDIEAVVELWEQVKNDVERYTRDFIP